MPANINFVQLQILTTKFENFVVGDGVPDSPFGFVKSWRDDVGIVPYEYNKEIALYMKATGIVRRIDDLGRVVIPKEMPHYAHP